MARKKKASTDSKQAAEKQAAEKQAAEKQAVAEAAGDGVLVKMTRSIASPYPGSHGVGSFVTVPPAVAVSWCGLGYAEPGDDDAAEAIESAGIRAKATPSETK